ncbi:HD domain-containing protein [Microbacterium neimengense]
MPYDIDELLRPPSATAALALETAERWCSLAVLRHSLRSWVWARALADAEGLDYDAELLFAAAALHDIGVAEPFDAHRAPFEGAGGAAAWVFAAGAGWPIERRVRLQEVIERHMWVEVDPAVDIEGHLLEVATSLDVAGVGSSRWDPQLLRAVTERLPRAEFAAEFDTAIRDQGRRKPASAAARLAQSGRIADGERTWLTLTR